MSDDKMSDVCFTPTCGKNRSSVATLGFARMNAPRPRCRSMSPSSSNFLRACLRVTRLAEYSRTNSASEGSLSPTLHSP